MSRLTLVVAATRTNGIGQEGRLPWRLPKEMAYFSRVTSNAPEGTKNAVIMGRNTWDSIPAKFRPLPNRTNIVVSRKASYDLGQSTTPAYLHHDLASAIARLRNSTEPIHRIFLIGGAMLYSESLALPSSSPVAFVDRILLTRIISPPFDHCDVFMPDFLGEWLGSKDDNGWKRVTSEGLSKWVGFEVPDGVQEENGVQYEFQLWFRES